MDDRKIIELFFAREERAIAELSAKYGSVCDRISKNILKDPLDAQECVNDAYLAVWNRIPPERPEPLRTYLFRIVRNLSIARYHANTAAKRNSYYDVALDELADCLESPVTVENELEAKELARYLNQFLDTLDRDSRIQFLCRYWYGDSIQDIAKNFHTNRHNVSVRLSRTRAKLKKYLMKAGVML